MTRSTIGVIDSNVERFVGDPHHRSMEMIRTVKTFLARLAGAPTMPRARRSGLYDVVSAARVRSRAPELRMRATDALPVVPPPVPPRPPTTRQRDGAEGEGFARRHLERAGLEFVAANVRYRDGEIDLVMRDRPRPSQAAPSLVFVEVRRRSRADHGGAGGSITAGKRRRIVAAAAHYLVGLGMRTLPPCRFDVVTLDGDAQTGLRIAWLRDAFRDEG